MMLLKCCTQYASNFGKLSSGHRTGKGVFIPITKKGNAKESWNYHTNAFISHASKVMIKILQARLQQYMYHELKIPEVQAQFRKGRDTRDQIANIHWIIEKAREYQKKYLLLLYCLYESLWLCGSRQIGKFFKRWEYQTTWPASWEICIPVKKQQNRKRLMSRLYIVTLLI